MIIFDVLGWLGAVFLLIAYYLTSAQKLTQESIVLHLLNLMGAACIVLNTNYRGAFGPMTLNIIWFLIALSSIVKSKKK